MNLSRLVLVSLVCAYSLVAAPQRAEKLAQLNRDLDAALERQLHVEDGSRWALSYHQLEWQNDPAIYDKVLKLINLKNDEASAEIIFGLVRNSPKRFSSVEVHRLLLNALAVEKVEIDHARMRKEPLEDARIRQEFFKFLRTQEMSAGGLSSVLDILNEDFVPTESELSAVVGATEKLATQKRRGLSELLGAVTSGLRLAQNAGKPASGKIKRAALQILANTEDPRSKVNVAASLLKAHSSLKGEVLSTLAKNIRGLSPQTSSIAVNAYLDPLADLDISDSAELLSAINSFSRATKDPDLKQKTLGILSRQDLSKAPETFQNFREDLSSADWVEARNAATALRSSIRAEDTETIRLLGNVARSPNDETAKAAILTLEHLSKNSSQEARKVLDELRLDPIPAVRVRCLDLIT